ncbi:kinase-like protein [Xylona heveae TC161]|uniref:EKC/KEOPS complex subunit BUD32 n=1 Tax=Xylona heveae (strain CBS 132557 / TC161) TaxID=1328760 RepID=A0A165JMA4_XYLHT|nr:kinase-like protein [Xylona heveae TC161]KZF26417.1 kinase-like protein [Xylona heveae TC161]
MHKCTAEKYTLSFPNSQMHSHCPTSPLSQRNIFDKPVYTMEIVRSAEGFKQVEGRYTFSYSSVIIRKNDQLYYGKAPFRGPKLLELNFSDLYEVEPLEAEDRGPKVKPTWTVLDSPHDYYVKTPDLWAYRGPELEQQILHEVEAYELLKCHPHPNISFYGGCQSTNGRVSGICMKRYTSTLAQKVNPGHFCKANFLTSDVRASVDSDAAKAWLAGILAGIHHLHSLGIVHNDITPSNIMFDEDGTAVLIDFEGCRKIGESLEIVRRTYGWHDPEVKTALEKNDLDAFADLQTLLIGTSVDDFVFKHG